MTPPRLEAPECQQLAKATRCMQILEGEAEGLLGIQSALGRYELDAEKADRQIVWFESIRIAPADQSQEAQKRWLAVFKDHNPNMVRNLKRLPPSHLGGRHVAGRLDPPLERKKVRKYTGSSIFA